MLIGAADEWSDLFSESKERWACSGYSLNVGTEMMTVADMGVIESKSRCRREWYRKSKYWWFSWYRGGCSIIIANSKALLPKLPAVPISSSLTSGGTQDVTNYEVRIRLDSNSYRDLIKRTGDNRKFPFSLGMNASADIKTMRKDNVLAVPITAVNAE